MLLGGGEFGFGQIVQAGIAVEFVIAYGLTGGNEIKMLLVYIFVGKLLLWKQRHFPGTKRLFSGGLSTNLDFFTS